MNESGNNNLRDLTGYYLNAYFEAKGNAQKLTGPNLALIGQVEANIAALPQDSEMKKIINSNIDDYFAQTKKQGQITDMNNADQLRQEGPKLALVKKETEGIKSRAAFINVAILIYGIANIGIILAIAFMK
ncbi:MAG: hypothetical protein K2J20_05335 [Bacilli bacterium]|nr:hypothetical protein [Bacilli bacterium]